MAIDVTLDVYIDWDDDGFTSADKVTNDVRNGSIILGITDPEGRVADIGELTVTLNNADRQYTPDNTGGSHYGKIRPGLPIKVVATVGAATIALFVGVVVGWNIQSQRYGPRYCDVVAQDRMRDYQDKNNVALPLQENTSADALLELIDAAVYESGAATGEVIHVEPSADGDTVTVGDDTYTMKTTLGSTANQVAIDARYFMAGIHDTPENLAAAINTAAGGGTYYTSATERNAKVSASAYPSIGTPDSERDTSVAIGDVSTGYTRLGRMFAFGGALTDEPDERTFKYVYIPLWKVGSPSGRTVTVRLEKPTGYGGPPSGTLGYTGAEVTFDADTLSSTAGTYVMLTFPEETIDAYAIPGTSQMWWVTVEIDGSASSSDYIVWGADADTLPFDNGVRSRESHYTGGAWSTPAYSNVPILWLPGVVEVSAVARGDWGNSIALSETGTSFQVSGSTLTGGAQPSFTTHYDTGVRTIEYAGDTWDGGVNAMSAITDVVRSEYGFFAVNRAGEPVFKNTDYWFKAANTSGTALDNVQQDLGTRYSLDGVSNRISVSYRQRRDLGILTVARSTEPIVVPGTSTYNERWNAWERVEGGGVKTVSLSFTDPDSKQPVGAISVKPLVPGTNYTVTDSEDSGGYDYTNEDVLKLSWAVSGTSVELTFTSSALGDLYVHDLYVQAHALSAFDNKSVLAEDADSIDTYGLREYEYELPLPVGEVFAQDLASYLLSEKAAPIFRIDLAVYDAVGEVAATNLLELGVFDVIVISEYQTATSAKKHLVTGIEYTFDAVDVMQVVFHVRSLGDNTYWILGETGFSELGETTRLAL